MAHASEADPVRRRKKSNLGFTIIELLVVSATIALLVAMVLPVLQQAKEKGKAADCINNMRQIYTGFAMFANDTDDYFPFTYYWWRTLGDAGYFGPPAPPYGPNTAPAAWTWVSSYRRWAIFRCAGEKGWPVDNGSSTTFSTAYDNDLDNCSYTMAWSINQYHYYCGYGCTTRPRLGFSKHTDNAGGRATAPLVMDKPAPYFGWAGNYQAWDIDFVPEGTLAQYYSPGIHYMFRHPGRRSNVLYLDGHVGSIIHIMDKGPAPWWNGSTYNYPVNYISVWNNPPDVPDGCGPVAPPCPTCPCPCPACLQ